MKYLEDADFRPAITKQIESNGWNVVHYPGDGIPDLFCHKHPFGFMVELKVIRKPESSTRLIEIFTHAQIPTYLDWEKKNKFSTVFIASAIISGESLSFGLYECVDPKILATISIKDFVKQNNPFQSIEQLCIELLSKHA